MRYRYSVSIGKPCEKCGEDTWLVYHGHNRCACGQYLWIERRDDIPPSEGLRLKYVQGTKLPEKLSWLVQSNGRRWTPKRDKRGSKGRTRESKSRPAVKDFSE